MRAVATLLLTGLFILLFCLAVRCGVFDDEATVIKARCYAKCLTMVSNVNDSSCLSTPCMECKLPCDRNFVSVQNCTQICPVSSSYCNQSCYFIADMKTWMNIYEGNKSTIGKPGVAHNTTINVTTLTLSWEPSVNASGTVVYLLKEKMTGDLTVNIATPLKGLVFLEPIAVLSAKDACSINPGGFRERNGLSFSFTVVALTEVSSLVEGPISPLIDFKKAEPLSLHNASIVHNPSPIPNSGDALEFRVWFTPALNTPINTKYFSAIKKAGGKCKSIHVYGRPANKEAANSLLTYLYDKLLVCNVSFTVYYMTECLPSKPKSIVYEYKGCHHLPSMNSSLCCLFDPLPTPDSAKAVRNLTYSLQTQSDLRFTARFAWFRPTQPCPDVSRYTLAYTVQRALVQRMIPWPVRKHTVNAYFDMVDLEPGLVRNVTVYPEFVGFSDLGVHRELMVTTPGVPQDETIVTNLNHSIHRPNSPSDRFSLNISWGRPKFNYSKINGYNVTHALLGDVTKNNVTQQLWYVVRELDYTQNISYQVLPVFRDSWIKAATTKGTASLPGLRDEEIMITAFNQIPGQSFVKNDNFYSLSVRWSPPSVQRSVSHYEVSYTLTGFLDDELDCPSKPSPKRKCMVDKTTTTSYTISNIRPTERIMIKVTPVFSNTYAFQGKSRTLTARAPGSWSSLQIALLVLGILVFIAIIFMLFIIFLRWKRKENIKKGKLVDRGIVIDHWEVTHNNLDLIEVVGEGAFGKVYKGVLLESPEQSSNTGSTSVSFARRSIRSTRSSKPDECYFVAVKMLHDSADDEQTREFLKEIQLMKDVGSHRNIVNMLGCGTISEPMFLIVEYLPNGDLLHYLRKRRGKAYFNMEKLGAGTSAQVNKPVYKNYTNVNTGFQQDKEDTNGIQLVSLKAIPEDDPNSAYHPFSTEDEELDDETMTSGDLMAFAWQVAQGMEYLSKRGYVHRDLAARNILVGNNKEAKVADFGLTRHMYEDLYRGKTNRRLPLKWMSIEAIFDQIFTSQSDVWSFGILLWEIVTLGGSPYPAKTNKELLMLLREGKRMEKPDTCDDEVYRIMMSCWNEKAEERPTFVQVREKFEDMMMRENPYFDPSSVDESRDYYNVPSFNSIQESDAEDDEVFNELVDFGKENETEHHPNGDVYRGKEENLSDSDKYDDEFKEKEPAMDDIESLLYRKQHHSIKH